MQGIFGNFLHANILDILSFLKPAHLQKESFKVLSIPEFANFPARKLSVPQLREFFILPKFPVLRYPTKMSKHPFQSLMLSSEFVQLPFYWHDAIMMYMA